ncbi:MAG: D-alanyl-D-alanine carboxypeptidase [Opitutae bacterium]|nr:D-alanyl-D-alanine carboxypeptidase [Opitutae bacterium]
MPKSRPHLLLLAAALGGAVSAKEARPPYLGAIVADAQTGQVLFEDKADVVTPPASMTKLMTFAVLHDQLASGALTLETPVTVTAEDSKIGGTQVWLKQGETFPVEELIYAMMIQSANDAAHALARTAAGSATAFVELMNTKARALGLAHTTFRTPHGLPPASRRTAEGDLTTPRDYAILSRYLLRETDVTKYTAVSSRPFGTKRPNGPVKMTNHNHLLGKVAGVNGLKTGFTNGAGYCLAASTERGGRGLVVVVMGSPDSKTRDLKVIELLERGFASRPPALPAVKTETPAPPAAEPAVLPTVRTDKTPAATSTPAGENSTAKDPVFIFRVNPPAKKP